MLRYLLCCFKDPHEIFESKGSFLHQVSRKDCDAAVCKPPVHVDIVARSPLLPVAAGCLWSEEGMAKGVLPALQACRESAGDGGVCGSTGLFCMEGECAVDGAGPLVCGDCAFSPWTEALNGVPVQGRAHAETLLSLRSHTVLLTDDSEELLSARF